MCHGNYLWTWWFCWESLIFLFSICFFLLLSWVTYYWCAFVTFQTGCLLLPAQSVCRTPVVLFSSTPTDLPAFPCFSALSLLLLSPSCSSVSMFTALQLLQVPFLPSLPLPFGKLKTYVNWFCLFIFNTTNWIALENGRMNNLILLSPLWVRYMICQEMSHRPYSYSLPLWEYCFVFPKPDTYIFHTQRIALLSISKKNLLYYKKIYYTFHWHNSICICPCVLVFTLAS